jgi:hypothetical protein
VGVCDDNSFVNLCANLGPVFEACGSSCKIVIPPLPRYLYNSCCPNKHHCTNRTEDDYQLNMLKNTTHLRAVLKEALLNSGTERFFVLDGVGGLLGVPAGTNRGTAIENKTELKNHCLPDGVHYTDSGYANLAKVICGAAAGVLNGQLTKAEPQKVSGKPAGSVYFWRGFSSPNGISGPRKPDSNPPRNQHHHGGAPQYAQYTQHAQHMYGGRPAESRDRGPRNSLASQPNFPPRRGNRHLPYWRNK